MSGESHRALREQVGAYALGQLSGDRWRAVHDHIEVCAACRADLDEIAPVAGLLGSARDRLRPDDLVAGDVPAAPPLSDDLIKEVRASAAPVSLASRRARRPALWIAAAAAGIVLAGGVGFAVGGSGIGGSGAAPSVPREAVDVRAIAPGIQAQGALIDHTWGLEFVLTATGFVRGERYAVTVVDDTGRTVSAGEFVGTGDAQMRCNLNSSVLRADASLVQVTAPDGEVVLDATV